MNTLIIAILLFGLLQSNTILVLCNDDKDVPYKPTPDNLKEIVGKMIENGKVQSENIGYVGRKSKNYSNFILLKKYATIDELIQLTENVNTTVACYAAMALADTSYSGLKDVFEKFIKHDRLINMQSGCSVHEDSISSVLYHRYWNRVGDVQNDSLLFQLDSVILYTTNPDWLITLRALENRIYTEPYKSQICRLAFDQGNSSAIFYLCTWHRAEYLEPLKRSLVKYLHNTEFKNVGMRTYRQTIDEILKFGDKTLLDAIVMKLKRDTFWDKNQMRQLFEDYGLYEVGLDF